MNFYSRTSDENPGNVSVWMCFGNKWHLCFLHIGKRIIATQIQNQLRRDSQFFHCFISTFTNRKGALVLTELLNIVIRRVLLSVAICPSVRLAGTCVMGSLNAHAFRNDIRLPVIMDIEWHVFELRSNVKVIIGYPVKVIYQA